MTPEAKKLLGWLGETFDRNAFALACDGKERSPAHELEKLGLAQWRGTSFGSSFWSITETGREALSTSNQTVKP